MTELDDFTIQLLVGLALAALAGFGTFITALWRCVHKQSKEIFRLKKGFILYMRLEAKETAKLHPGTITDEDIEEIVKQMMTDDEGRI